MTTSGHGGVESFESPRCSCGLDGGAGVAEGVEEVGGRVRKLLDLGMEVGAAAVLADVVAPAEFAERGEVVLDQLT